MDRKYLTFIRIICLRVFFVCELRVCVCIWLIWRFCCSFSSAPNFNWGWIEDAASFAYIRIFIHVSKCRGLRNIVDRSFSLFFFCLRSFWYWLENDYRYNNGTETRRTYYLIIIGGKKNEIETFLVWELFCLRRLFLGYFSWLFVFGNSTLKTHFLTKKFFRMRILSAIWSYSMDRNDDIIVESDASIPWLKFYWTVEKSKIDPKTNLCGYHN